MAQKMPADWNLAFDQLIESRFKGRHSVYDRRDEERWAKEYERSLLPKDARYPVEGDIYVCEEDTDVGVLYFGSGNYPLCGSGPGRILKGERIWISGIDPKVEPRPLSVAAYIETNDEFLRRCVPESVWSSPDFTGIVITLHTRVLLRAFRLEHPYAA